MKSVVVRNSFLVLLIFLLALFSSKVLAQSEIELNPQGIVLPKYSTADRNDLTATAGQFIYNLTSQSINFYNGTEWINLAFSDFSDVDGDTKVQVEEMTDEDIIRMDANSLEVLRVMADSTGRERLEIENSLSNIFIGCKSGCVNTSGNYNVFLGTSSGAQNTTGHSNVFVGALAGFLNTTGENNSFFGTNAGANNTNGGQNCFFGESAGLLNTSGTFNSFYGLGCGEQNTTGESNSFFGGFAGQQNTIGDYNSSFGVVTGQLITEGSYNSFYGASAALFKLRGHYNSYLGYQSGANDVAGSYNTLIGSLSDFNDGIDSLESAIAIGYNSRVGCNNCAVIGGTGVDAVNVGIGTSTPTSRLEVHGGDIKIIGGSIYDDGVMLSVPDYVFSEEYELKSLEEVSEYIQKNSHLEGFPTMYDKAGWANVSLQDRDMKLLEKVEELFLHTISQSNKLKEQQKTLEYLISENIKLKKEIKKINSSIER